MRIFFLKLFALSFALVAAQVPATSRNRSEEIRFKSFDGVTLAGTLILPKGEGPFRAVVFLHGSGAEVGKNSMNRTLKFVHEGFAALIYDKRGVGGSEGEADFNRYFSFDTLAEDAASAMQYLATRPEIDPNKIGLVGQSQSGWVAPLVVEKFPKAAFMVIVSGSVCTVGEDNIFEREARLKKEGFSAEEIAEVTRMHLVDIEVTRTGNGVDRFGEMWQQNKTKRWFKRVYLGDSPMPADSRYRNWYRTVVDFDPVAHLKNITIPVLWLYGQPELDRFCPVTLSMANLEKLKASGKRYEIISVPGADHSLLVKRKDFATTQEVFSWLDQNVG